MADQQRIYPVRDPEAPPPHPTAPLVPPGTYKSDQLPPHRNFPVMHSKPPKRRRSCFCRCLCCSICFLLLLVTIIAILSAVFYFVFQPKIPNYSVDRMRITKFNMNTDMSLSATFNVAITAKNPNEKIGIYYLDGSRITVLYTGTPLCQGSLPKFYQGHKNTTVLDVPLSGQTQDASALFQSLQADQQQTGSIPLKLKVRVPVRIKVGALKLMRWIFLVNCDVAVDSLSVNNDISIKNSSCKFGFRL